MQLDLALTREHKLQSSHEASVQSLFKTTNLISSKITLKMSTEQEEIIEWHAEAEAVIQDVKSHVKSIAISEKLITGKFLRFSLLSENFPTRISFADIGCYLNLKTLEGKELTCLLDGSGFKIVGFSFDCCDEEDNSESYETIYALIQSFSPAYTQSFGNALVEKLKEIS